MFYHSLFKYFIGCIIFALFCSCHTKQFPYQILKGQAQGTTYHIRYKPSKKNIKKTSIDSIFKVIDKSMSLWDTTSIISKFNQPNVQTIEIDTHFKNVLEHSFKVYKISNGRFDPSIGHLVKSYGFIRKNNLELPNQKKIDSLLKMIGLDKIELINNQITKKINGIELDFNAIAQGYTVDVIGDFFEANSIQNYMIEVGGELKTKGLNQENKNWKIGVEMPNDNETQEKNDLQLVLEISDKSLATSGNYRNFMENHSQRFSHIIHPKTGKPTTQNTIAVNVIADTATDADAWATAFSVMEKEEAIALAKKLNLDIQIITKENNELILYQSEGFKKRIQKK